MPINLGQITFGIGADTTRLRSSIDDITNFGAAVNSAARNTNTAGTAIEAAFRRQEAAVISALQKVQAFQDKVAALKAPPNLAAGFNQQSTQALDQFVQRMTSGQMSALQFQREMERFNVTLNNSQRALKQWGDAHKAAADGAMVANLQKLSSAAILVAGPLSGIATRISVVAALADHFSLSWAGMIAGVAAGAYGFYKFGTAAVEVEKKLQNIELTFTAVSGSSTLAQIQMKYLAEFADKAGVKFDDLAKNYAQITAAAKGTVLEGERTQMIFEAVTLAGAKLGLSGEEVKGTLIAIQQMMSKGRISAEELRQQLGDRFPGAVQIMAKAVGVTTQELDKMMRAGDLNVSMLVRFAEEVKKRYGIDESTKIDTITAAENRLANARTRAIDSFDKVIGFTTAYTNVLNRLTDGINGVSTKAQDLVQKTLQVGTALAAVFASQIILRGVTSLAGGIIGLASAIASLNVATAAGAFTSFAKLLLTASVAIAAYYGSEKLMQSVLEDSKKSFLNVKPAVDDYIKAQQSISSSVRGPTNEYIKQTEELFDTQMKQREALTKQAEGFQSFRTTLEKVGNSAEFVDKVMSDMGEGALIKKLQASDAAIEKTRGQLIALGDILKRQTDEETLGKDDPIKALTERQALAVKNASDTIRELGQNFANISKDPAEKEWANLQVDIAKKIENFRDQLTRVQLPLEQVTNLTNAYGDALRKVKEGEAAFDLAKLQGDAIEKASRAITSNKDMIKNLYKEPQAKEFGNLQVEINESIDSFKDKLVKAQVPAERIRQLVDEYSTSLHTLKEGQHKIDWDTNTVRQTVALKNATDTVKELTAQYDVLFKAPGAKEWGTIQNEVSKQVENFRDKLTETKLPAAEVTELTNKYAAALRKLKEGEYTFKTLTSSFQAIEGIFSRGVDQGLTSFIDVVVDGKDKMLAFGDTAKAVAKDILKTMLTLAALNPLKNFLFGTNEKVLGGTAGMGGALGGLGNWFGSLGGSPEAKAFAGGITPMAFGGIMTSSGPKPLRRYSGGGIARGSQFAEYGEGSKPEAYVPLPDGRSIPVSMSGGMGGGVEMHIHEAPGFKAQTTQSKGSSGQPRIDVAFKQMFRAAWAEDIGQGGPASQMMERQFGLNRAKGLGS